MSILRKLDHPNLIKTKAVFEDNCFVRIVCDICEGGNPSIILKET